MGTQLTTEPITAAKVHEPEFVDVQGLRQLFGIRRSLGYALLKDQKIRGVSLRRHGQVRGKRLFVVESVRKFLREQMEAENA
jgi:hypothetical protein